MAEEGRRPRGLLDTSVVVDLERLEVEDLPSEMAVSSITMAELAAGPHATADAEERARRQDRLQRAEATFDHLPFDTDAARAYGRIYAATLAAGRKARGARAVDLLVAATALPAGLPLYTRNATDFGHLRELMEIVAVDAPKREPRQPGSMKGKIRMAPDMDEVDNEIADLFENGGVFPEGS